MAVRLKGEVAFVVEGETFTLCLDFNALCDLEEDVPGLMDGTAEIRSPKIIRRVFQAGLQAKHPGLDLTSAGQLIHALGMEKAGEVVSESFAASFPEAVGGEEAARPRSPRRSGPGKKP